MSYRMIPKVKELKLIAMYLHISDVYKYDMMYSCQRFSNNSKPEFTDEEVMTIYPLSMFVPSDCIEDKSLLDSMPIITCTGKRSGKVAREITDKGFCSTKGIYCYGLKLHALAFYRPHHLPFPEQFQLTPASENDLNLYKEAWGEIENWTFFGDKIYHDSPYFQNAENSQNSLMLTPVKAIKGQDAALKQRDNAANDLFSTAVSRIRQPIESFFNWLIEKTYIQRESKVRSTKGLMVYVFGRTAAAFIALIFNS